MYLSQYFEFWVEGKSGVRGGALSMMYPLKWKCFCFVGEKDNVILENMKPSSSTYILSAYTCAGNTKMAILNSL